MPPLQHYNTLYLSIYLPLPVSFIFSNALMLLFIILSFQIEELSNISYKAGLESLSLSFVFEG